MKDNDIRMVVDLQATLAKVRKQTKRLVDENDEQYNARTLHLTYLLIEHKPDSAVLVPVEEVNDDNKR